MILQIVFVCLLGLAFADMRIPTELSFISRDHMKANERVTISVGARLGITSVILRTEWSKDGELFFTWDNGLTLEYDEGAIIIDNNFKIVKHDSTEVVLDNTTYMFSGTYTCKISFCNLIATPTFPVCTMIYYKKADAEITFVKVPEEPLKLEVSNLERNDNESVTVDARCTVGASYPEARVQWNYKGHVESYIADRHEDEFAILIEKYKEKLPRPVESWIRFIIEPQDFVDGLLQISCSASIAHVYNEDATVLVSNSFDNEIVLVTEYGLPTLPEIDGTTTISIIDGTRQEGSAPSSSIIAQPRLSWGTVILSHILTMVLTLRV